MKIKLESKKSYKISDTLYGIFLEDINFACDGGLNANQVENYSFDGVYQDRKAKGEVADYLRYWTIESGQLFSGNENPLHENSHYGIIRCPKKAFSTMHWKDLTEVFGGKACISNLGYNGHKFNEGKPAICVKGGENYVFSAYFRNESFKGKVKVSVEGEDGILLAESDDFKVEYKVWKKLEVSLCGLNTGYGKLKIELTGSGDLDIDCVEFRAEDVWGKDDPKWQYGKLRKDLVEALQELHPKFMRFPGGCIVEGEYLGNEYNWKETVGELYERKSKYNVWSESLENGGYNQSFQVGFYELLCLCEDLSMKPLPTLWCGLNCQCRANTRKEPCTGYEIGTPEFQSEVIDMYLDLIEFCNGDPEKNEWAALRKKMGHPAPFNLDRIGIGNENYGKDYFTRYHVIKEEIQKRYPEIKCILSTGPSPDEDRVAPAWKYAKKKSPDSILDEHSYEKPEWFIREEKRFDSYNRKGPKVYMGEYAANGIPKPRKAVADNGNYFETAIAEAAFMTGLERNGDIVEMSSYAPLFNLVGSDQWRHNLIDFNPENVCLTSNWFIQKAFASNFGDTYIPCTSKLPDRVFVSCLDDGEKKYLRVVNLSNEDQKVEIEADFSFSKAEVETISSPEGLLVKNRLEFKGKTDYKIKDETETFEIKDSSFVFTSEKNTVAFLKLY